MNTFRGGGIGGALKRFFTVSSKLNEGFIALAEFEGNSIMLEAEFKNARQVVYRGSQETFLRKRLDEAIDERMDYPVQQTSHLMAMFETRRLKSSEIFAVIIAALLGGVVGGLITSSLTALIR